MSEVGYGRAIFSAGGRVWGRALSETVVVGFISLLPLLAAAFRELLLPDAQSSGEPFTKAFLSGQLLFYAMGFVAAVMWSCNKDFRSFFPLRIIINMLCILEIIICSLVIGFDPTLSKTNMGFLAQLSVWMFVLSAALYTLMVVVGDVHVNVGQSFAKSAAKLGDEVRRKRGLE